MLHVEYKYLIHWNFNKKLFLSQSVYILNLSFLSSSLKY